jgi:hypothetical protein
MGKRCTWVPIQHFDSLRHYEDFLKSINADMDSGSVRQKPLDSKRAWGTAWDEKWFECVENGEVWRLVAPDPPFRGVFKPVE